MFKYTLIFIKRGNKLLMLNRIKSPWMGSWNGVGGKIESNETPLESAIREVYEETNIKINESQIKYKGVVTWNESISKVGGLHLYLAEVNVDFKYETPKVVTEGILDWKDISWIGDFDNYGVCDNIPFFIDDVVNNDELINHECLFDDKILISVTKKSISNF